MTALSDTLTISLVLVLLFGSIALYLYTRIQQAEQRINLLESIVLELKMSSEVKTYTELPASEIDYDTGLNMNNVAEYKSFDDSDIENSNVDNTDNHSHVSSVSSKHSVHEKELEQTNEVGDIDFYKSVLDNTSSNTENTTKSNKTNVNYDSMNIKELHSLAKQRGITGVSVMKKQAIIEALKTSDKSVANSLVEPGSTGTSTLGSFLETSAFLGQTENSSRTITIDDE
jgi:hypothetical protein